MNALAHYYAAAASAFHEIFYYKFPENFFSEFIPEKYRYFSGNFQKNSAGNFRKFPNSQPYTQPIGLPRLLQRAVLWTAELSVGALAV